MSAGSIIRVAGVALTLGATLALGVAAPGVLAGDAPQVAAPWLPDVELALRLDSLSLLFALLITGIGAAVFAFAADYFDQDAARARFYGHLAGFVLAMLGVVLADDLIFLYVCWELTTLSSFFLVGFEHERAEAREAARHALLLNVAGGLALLAGVILLGMVGGTTRLSELALRGEEVRAHALYVPALLCVALAAFIKSAQFPFHGWLPRAMEAPTPASAYLHAATMVKAGVYLLARLSPVLAGTAVWSGLVTTFGAITMVVGGARALGETHLKRSLAYATVGALGVFVALLGVGGEHAVAAAMIYLLAHGLYKGALFLFAGTVSHRAHTLESGELRGLGRAMPWSAAGALLAGASMAGVPASLGFLGKDLLYAASWPASASELAALAVLAAGLVARTWVAAVARVVAVRPLSPTGPAPWAGPVMWMRA